MNLDTQDIIFYTRENMQVYRRFYNTRQHQAHYQMGFALNLVMENSTLSEAAATLQLDITERETRYARKTFYLFRLWPTAIYQLGDLTTTDLNQLTSSQIEEIHTEIIMTHGSDPTDYLLDFPEDLTSDESGYSTDGAIALNVQQESNSPEPIYLDFETHDDFLGISRIPELPDGDTDLQ
jgi:hypothetical protein